MSADKERKIRKARRVELRCTLGFSSGEIEGDATITNISTAGCRAESDINMAEGTRRSGHPSASRPVTTSESRTSLSTLGLRPRLWPLNFILFFPSERARLRTFIEKIK